MSDESSDNPLFIRHGANLPHWTRPTCSYAVTFRLADALPRHVLDSWIRERNDIITTAEHLGRELSDYEKRRLHELHSERVETFLDAGHGACVLREHAVAKIVADALHHFDGKRYDLHAWCIMPNHVHVVLATHKEHPLSGILHSWKSYTALIANRHLGRSGEFWQVEYYDHLIRDAEDFSHSIAYVLNNPSKAGLKNWPWRWAKQKEPTP